METEKLYRITPIDKKSIEYEIEAYESDKQDRYLRGFVAQFRYRWGVGFRSFEDPVYEEELRSGIQCDPTLGWGAELDDLIGVWVDFHGEWSEYEQDDVRRRLEGVTKDENDRWGEAWLFDGDHGMTTEYDSINIYGPVKIDLVDAKGYGDHAVLQQNVQPIMID